MSFTPGGASSVATQRIRIFSVTFWVIGSIVATIIAATTAYSAILGGGGGGGLIGDPYENNYPWDDATPLEADNTSDTWGAAGSAVIRIPRQDPTMPYEVRLTLGDNVELYIPDPEDVGRANPPYPNYITGLSEDRPEVVVPGDADLELWVVSPGRWELILQPVDGLEITDTLAGIGDAYVIYRGGGSRGTFIHRGDGIFFVNVYTPYDNDYAIIDNGEIRETVNWIPADVVVFAIESSGDEGWSIELDVPVDPVPEPTKTPTG